jgi:hypothetical protein
MTKTKNQKARAKAARKGGAEARAPAALRSKPKGRDRKGKEEQGTYRARETVAPVALGFELSVGTKKSAMAHFTNSEVLTDLPRDVLGQYRMNGSSGFLKRLRLQLAPYSEYRFTKLIVRYVPRVGAGTEGDIFMAYNPDANAVAPTTVDDFAQTKPYVTGVPWTVHTLDLTSQMGRGDASWRKVVDYDAILQPNAIEENLYSYGKFFVLSEGVGVPTDIVGRLWVDYSVEARNPRAPKDPELYSTQIFASEGLSLAAVFGTAPIVDTPGIMSMWDSNSILIRRPGTYVMQLFQFQNVGGSMGHNYCPNPITTSVEDIAVPNPEWYNFLGPADLTATGAIVNTGDQGYWHLNGVPGSRGLARKMVKIYGPTLFHCGAAFASSGALSFSTTSIHIGCGNTFTFGWAPAIAEPGSDGELV